MPIVMMPPEIVWESDPLYAELETLARVGSFQHPRILGWEYRKGHENAGPLYRRIGYVGAVLQSPLDTVYGATSAVPGTPGVPRMEPAVAPVYFLTAQQIEAMGAVGEAMLADGVIEVMPPMAEKPAEMALPEFTPPEPVIETPPATEPEPAPMVKPASIKALGRPKNK